MQVQAPGALLQALLSAVSTPARPPSAQTAAAAPTTPLPSPGAAAAAPGPIAGPTAPSVSMLVTLSTALDPRPRDTLAKTQARDGLDLLAGLYRDQVTGLASPQRLRTLRDWARRRLRPDDPELGAILDEIETRLLVELAKAGERDPEADPFAD